VANLFFLLSGENKTLPFAELLAILEAEEYDYSIIEKLDQVIRVEVDINSINSIYLRSAFTRICALELFACESSEEIIIQYLNDIKFTQFLDENKSFAVRIKRIRNYAKKQSVMRLERIIGKIILKKTNKTKVNLVFPDSIFVGILTSRKFVFGIKIAAISPKPFGERRPRKKPFFHPSAMPSKLARSMVNLARAKKNDVILDPFCGTGSTLIEATFISCQIIGLDAQRKMIKGCKKNLNFFNINPEGLILADARKHPLFRADCIVTDPPYGRCCSTMKSTTKKIVKETLCATKSLLNKGNKICIASPKSINLSILGEELGYKHLESHYVYVHRSLTREIAVFEKK
jgi:tRNA (guanine10-N2)-dimethyltransferase